MQDLQAIRSQLIQQSIYKEISGDKAEETTFYYTYKDKRGKYYGCIGYSVLSHGKIIDAKIERSIL